MKKNPLLLASLVLVASCLVSSLPTKEEEEFDSIFGFASDGEVNIEERFQVRHVPVEGQAQEEEEAEQVQEVHEEELVEEEEHDEEGHEEENGQSQDEPEELKYGDLHKLDYLLKRTFCQVGGRFS